MSDKNAFVSKGTSQSVTTDCCLKHRQLDETKLSVVDTPGFFDTKQDTKVVSKMIYDSLRWTLPGPHAFLIVLACDHRFTEEEQKAMQWIARVFKMYYNYGIVIFTKVDQLDDDMTIEQFVASASPELRELLARCGNRYYAVNNRDKRTSNSDTVTRDLIAMINSMVLAQGDRPYSAPVIDIIIATMKKKETGGRSRILNNDRGAAENNTASQEVLDAVSTYIRKETTL